MWVCCPRWVACPWRMYRPKVGVLPNIGSVADFLSDVRMYRPSWSILLLLDWGGADWNNSSYPRSQERNKHTMLNFDNEVPVKWKSYLVTSTIAVKIVQAKKRGWKVSILGRDSLVAAVSKQDTSSPSIKLPCHFKHWSFNHWVNELQKLLKEM